MRSSPAMNDVRTNSTPADADYDAFWSHDHVDVVTPVHHTLAVAGLLRGPLVVDLGCGTARLAEVVPGIDVVGFDASVDALRAAQRRGVPGAQADVRALPVRDGSVRELVSLDVLEHLVDPRPLLAEVARVLAPGGVAVVGTPNPRYLKHLLTLAVRGRMFVTSDATSIYRGGHLHDHTEADVRALCDEAGLRVASVHAVHAHRAAPLARRLFGDRGRGLLATGLLYRITRA